MHDDGHHPERIRHVDVSARREPPAPRQGVAWSVSPVDASGLGVVVAGWVIIAGITTIVGLAIVEWWVPSRFGAADADVNQFFEARRTALLDELAHLGSAFSDTVTIVILGLVLIPLFLWWFRRWHEVGLIVGVTVLEVVCYLVPSRIVARERPPVEQISGPTNDHSFPSGHVAAAIVFYGALALIVVWHTDRRWAEVTWMVIVFVVPTWVAWSRVYVGAHHVTDYVGSLIIGAGVLLVVAHVIRSEDRAPPVRDRRA